MKQQERRIFLIQRLLNERKAYGEIQIPETSEEQKQLLRGLMNLREAKQIRSIMSSCKFKTNI